MEVPNRIHPTWTGTLARFASTVVFAVTLFFIVVVLGSVAITFGSGEPNKAVYTAVGAILFSPLLVPYLWFRRRDGEPPELVIKKRFLSWW